MEDLIRRSDAIKAIEALECFGYIECKTKGLVKDINAIPSADRWIPCEERMPEEGRFLVTFKKSVWGEHCGVDVAYFSPNHRWFCPNGCEIIAWMPLPEPWKGADDE